MFFLRYSLVLSKWVLIDNSIFLWTFNHRYLLPVIIYFFVELVLEIEKIVEFRILIFGMEIRMLILSLSIFFIDYFFFDDLGDALREILQLFPLGSNGMLEFTDVCFTWLVYDDTFVL